MSLRVGELHALLDLDNKQFNRGMEGAKKRLQSFGQNMRDVGRGLTTSVTLPLAAVGGAAIKASVDFETAFAGVRKTVDATEGQLAELEQGILDMSKEIPASSVAIADVAASAGQLGIETDNILGFTRTMIDLGEASNLSSEQAATALARLANITQMPQDQFDRLGSVVVDLGNNLATTEAEIVEMGLRIAGAGSQVGISQAEILGLAGALSSVGIAADAGGSAISRVMMNIATEVSSGGDKLSEFARVAGMTAGQFQEAFRTDAAGAMVTFVEGLGEMSGEGQNLFGVLEGLGITEIRTRDALLRAAGAGELLRDSIAIGNEAWEENTALATEAAQRYATSESQLGVLQNKVVELGISLGDKLVPALIDLVDAAEPVIGWLGDAIEAFGDLDPKVQAIGVALAASGPVLIGVGMLSSALAALAGPTGAVLLVASAIGTLVAYWPEIKEFATNAKDALVDAFEGARDAISSAFGGLLGIIKTPINAVIDMVNDMLRSIESAMSFTVPVIGTEVSVDLPTIPKLHGGAIMPGTSGPDQFLAMIAPGEAVVPSKAMRGGWPAVLEWFQKQGVPGFRQGYVSGGGRGGSVGAGEPWGELIQGLSVAADAARRWAAGIVDQIPGVSKALDAYHHATLEAAKGGLGLSKAGGLAAGALAFVASHSDALNDALDAVAEGLAALLAPLDALLEALGSTLTAGLVGAGAGAAVGSMFGPAGTVIGAAVGSVAGIVGDIMGSAAEEEKQLLEEAAQSIKDAADAWQDQLGQSQFYEVMSATPDVSDLERQARRLRDAMDKINEWGRWPWEEARYKELKDQLSDVNREIRELLEGAPEDVMNRLKEILSVTTRDLQGAVQGAFSAETAEDFAAQFGDSLETRVRDALVTAFLESSTMAPLFDALSTGITDAVKDAELTPDEMDALRGTIDEIRDRSEPLYDALVDLGLAGEDASDSLREMSGSLRNVPQLFKTALVRSQIADAAPIPALASGGYVPATPGGRIVRLAEGGEGEYVIPESRAGGSGSAGGDIHIHGDVYGWDDFRRKVAQAQAQNDRRSDLVFQGA